MAGGVGSRFWPISRYYAPKQFHDLLGTGKSMLEETANRFLTICPKENIYVVTNVDYYELVKKDLPYLSDNQILLEPEARNTAACIAYSCYKIISKNKAAIITISPADHYIFKVAEFEKTIQTAIKYATKNEDLVTIGIVPTRPDTGYGYIQYDNLEKNELKKVKKFTEKPNRETVLQFLASGDFVWNAGIFIFNALTIKKSFQKFLPDQNAIFESLSNFYFTDQESKKINNFYKNLTSISFDYGIMEKSDNVYVILGYFGWSDVGTWKSLYELAEKNTEENVVEGLAMIYNSTNCIIKTPKDKLVVINGLDGFIVAESDGALLICKKDDEQKVKQFVQDIKQKFGNKYS